MRTPRDSRRVLDQYFQDNPVLTFEEAREFVEKKDLYFGPEVSFEDVIFGIRDRGLIKIDFEAREYHRLPAI